MIFVFFLIILLLVHENLLSGEFDYNREKENIFIERTQRLLPSKHYFNGAFNHFIEPVDGKDSFYVTCPFNRDCAIVRPAQDKMKMQFVLIDYQENVCTRHFLNYKNIHALALAAHHEMFAVIQDLRISILNCSKDLIQ